MDQNTFFPLQICQNWDFIHMLKSVLQQNQ